MLKRNSRISDEAVAVLAALIAVSLAACGGPALSTTGPSPGFGDDTTVVLSTALDNVEAGGQRALDFTLPRTGTLALTVRWTDSTNSVIAVLTGVPTSARPRPIARCGDRSNARGERVGKG